MNYTKNYYSNYKKVGNIVFPHYLEEGEKSFSIEVDEVVINSEIADEEFKMPFAQFNAEENILLNRRIEDETFEFSEEDWNASEIIARYTQAVGEQFNLEQKKSLKVKGIMTLGSVEVPFLIYGKNPDKFRMEMTIINVQAVLATNGKEAWEISPFDGISEPAPTSHYEVHKSMDMLSFGREVISYGQDGSLTEYMGKTHVKGRESHVIQITTRLDETLLYFFDTENYYLLLRHNKDTGEQEFYGDYQPLKGSQNTSLHRDHQP
ncbi:MAG: hypothetical protein HC880_08095 [Bacteroidia bacterium]|nr:hypothetical protein [Bacteroidia bacterium]